MKTTPVDRSRAWGLLACLLAVLAYANTLGNGFVWDDRVVVVGSDSERSASRLGAALASPDQLRPYYRPLTRALFVIEWALWGPRPAAFHALSVCLHALNVFLLFTLARELLGSPSSAFAAASLLATHPVHSEAVAFISARNNVLALTFMLAAALALLAGLRRGARAWAWVAAALLFLGASAKEPALAAIVPLAVLAVRAREPGAPIRWPAVAGWLGPATLAMAAYLAVRAAVLGSILGVEGWTAGAGRRALAALAIVPRYLEIVVWPGGLTVLHSPPAGADALAPDSLLLWAVLAAAVLLIVLRPTTAGLFGLAWFGAALLPIANLVPIPSAPIAERYFTIAAVGLWILAADLLARLPAGPAASRAIVAGTLAVALALGALTVRRNLDWRSDATLFASAVRAAPGSAEARFNLGTALREAGDLPGSVREWRVAVALDPAHAEALTQLGTAAASEGRLAEAEGLWTRALAARPDFPMAHFNLGRLKERTGRSGEARKHYEAFLRGVRPEYRSLVPEAQRRLERLGNAAP